MSILMKKVVLIFLICVCYASSSHAGVVHTNSFLKTIPKERIVYICDNGKTVVYHISQNCSALNRCKAGVSKMKESAAKNEGKRVCKVCS